MTITANTTAGGPAGSIDDTTIDSQLFDGSSASNPSIVHVSGDIYAVAYQGPDGDGFVKTVSIDSEGQIGNSVIDTLEFDTNNGGTPDIVGVSGNIFAIAYQGVDNDGFVKTVSIDATGQIGNSVIDTLEFDTNNGGTPDIIYISGIIYAIAYQGSGNDGFIRTVSIDASGSISNSVIASYEFDAADGWEPSITHVSGDIYAIAYRGSSSKGFLKTISIIANGQIGSSTIDTLEFDSSQGQPQVSYRYPGMSTPSPSRAPATTVSSRQPPSRLTAVSETASSPATSSTPPTAASRLSSLSPGTPMRWPTAALPATVSSKL